MKLLPLILVAGPAVALACGPFFYPAPPTLDRFPERLPVKTMRELLREANTLGSKSPSIEMTSIAVDMKVAIEQLREQVQNVE